MRIGVEIDKEVIGATAIVIVLSMFLNYMEEIVEKAV